MFKPREVRKISNTQDQVQSNVDICFNGHSYNPKPMFLFVCLFVCVCFGPSAGVCSLWYLFEESRRRGAPGDFLLCSQLEVGVCDLTCGMQVGYGVLRHMGLLVFFGSFAILFFVNKNIFVYSSVSPSSLIWETLLLLFPKPSRDVTASIAKCWSCNVNSKEKFWPPSFFVYADDCFC